MDRNRAVEVAAGPIGIRSLILPGLALFSVCARNPTGPLHQIGAGLPVPLCRECEVGNAIGTVHEETPFGSPWRESRDRLRVICREKNPNLRTSRHHIAIARDGTQTCGGRGWSESSGYKNTSSTFFPKARAILNASGRLGSYFPVSMALMVPRATPTWAASSACDHSFSARNTRSRVFIDTARNTESIQCSTERSSAG